MYIFFTTGDILNELGNKGQPFCTMLPSLVPLTSCPETYVITLIYARPKMTAAV